MAVCRRPHRRPIAFVLIATGVVFLALAVVALTSAATEGLTFNVNAAFTVALIAIVIAQIPPRGDIGARIGIVLLAVPLIIHFYAPFALRYISGDDVGLPMRVQAFGQWSLIFSALATPYCFAPRPFSLSAARIPPLLIAMFVTALTAVIVRRAAEEGMTLARDGFGIALDPLAPVSMLALYIMGLAAVTWTLVSCLAARSAQRRLIGAGLALVMLAGYAFEWSLQYLLGMVGLLMISSASRLVKSQERVANKIDHQSAIDEQDWQGFVLALSARIAEGLSDDNKPPSVLTVGDDEGGARTHWVWTRAGLPTRLTVMRSRQSLSYLDFVAGEKPGQATLPALTLSSVAGIGPSLNRRHPEPPKSSGTARKSGDGSFDARFQLRDRGADLACILASETDRQVACEQLDGWLALWPGQALRYRVFPRQSARIEHPISPSILRSINRGDSLTTAPTVGLLRFLGSMAERGVGSREDAGDRGEDHADSDARTSVSVEESE